MGRGRDHVTAFLQVPGVEVAWVCDVDERRLAPAVKAVADWKLLDFYGAPVAGQPEPVTIEPHAMVAINRPFTAESAALAYQLDVKTRPAEGFTPPAPRLP